MKDQERSYRETVVRKARAKAKAEGISTNTLAGFCGVTNKAVQDWFNGNSVPTGERLVALQEFNHTQNATDAAPAKPDSKPDQATVVGPLQIIRALLPTLTAQELAELSMYVVARAFEGSTEGER